MDRKVAKKGSNRLKNIAGYFTAFIRKLQFLLFSLTIFLIPANLALHFFTEQATHQGILIDYLIPKLYISDLPIFAILILELPFFIHTLFRRRQPRPRFAQTSGGIVLIWLIYLLFTAQIAPKIYASIWMWLKYCEFTLFAFWIKNHLDSIHRLKTPLILSLLLQSLIAVFQWFQKKSLLGYLLLGETTIRSSSFIAKTTVNGEVRPLPYGTTPHPNVLAGFIAFGVLILTLIIYKQHTRLLSLKNIFNHLIPSLMFTGIIFLTQSTSALLGLIIGLFLFPGYKILRKYLIPIVIIFLALALLVATTIESTSVSRRLGLAEISLQVILHHPIYGAGLNNFTQIMDQYGFIPGTTRFLQPVHNIYLLYLAETGLIGLLPLVYLFRTKLYSLISKFTNNSQSFIPLIFILAVGMVDHYPITLQTGQMMLAVAMAIPWIKNSIK
jgi:O-antigen ligase